MEWVDRAGMLKFDFLGLRTLEIMAKTVANIKTSRGEDVDLAHIPQDDRKTFELLSRGETSGVFQCEKSGFRELMARLQPDRFEDLIVMVALYRPGPLKGGLVDQFIECKHGRATPEYLLPEMEDILRGTYGVMVYQDQVMRILNAVADFPMNEALTLIKAIGKKKLDYMTAQEKVFMERTAARGVPAKAAKKLYDQILAFAGYGFNKAHSTAYGLVAYQTAYLKANYPVEFMAGLLTCEMIHSEKTVEYAEECRHMGIEVLPPDVTQSVEAFRVEGDAIRFGLGGIKGVGHKAIEAIVSAREESEPFLSIFHFCETVDLKAVNRAVVEALVKAGAFDTIGTCRAAMIAAVEKALAGGSARQRDRQRGQANLFDALAGSADTVQEQQALPQIPEWPENVKLAYEKETLGFYMSSHPLARYADELRLFSTCPVGELDRQKDGADVVVGGWIQSVRYMTVKRGKTAGERMAALVFEDLSDTCTAVVFPDAFKEYGPLIEPHKAVFLTGRLDLIRQQPNIQVSRVIEIDRAGAELAKAVRITVDCTRDVDERVQELSELLRERPGTVQVILVFDEGDDRHTVYRVSETLRVCADRAFFTRVEQIVGKGNVALLGNGNGLSSRPSDPSADPRVAQTAGA